MFIQGFLVNCHEHNTPCIIRTALFSYHSIVLGLTAYWATAIGRLDSPCAVEQIWTSLVLSCHLTMVVGGAVKLVLSMLTSAIVVPANVASTSLHVFLAGVAHTISSTNLFLSKLHDKNFAKKMADKWYGIKLLGHNYAVVGSWYSMLVICTILGSSVWLLHLPGDITWGILSVWDSAIMWQVLG